MTRGNEKLDRCSAVDAAAVMSAICPHAAQRYEVLRCLLDSIAYVECRASQAWAVTLFGNRFRLNVGIVEAFTCGVVESDEPVGGRYLRSVRVLTLGKLPSEVLKASQKQSSHVDVRAISYKPISGSQHAVFLSFEQAGELGQWYERLRPAHQRYLEAALQTSTGRVRHGTTHRRSHSEGLVEYARAFCGRTNDGVAQTPSNEGDPDIVEFFEGHPIATQTTRYERSDGARRACLAQHGYACQACGFSFGVTYGTVASHYIQVHHLNPLSAMGSAGASDPINDMVPLCANCHAVAHFRNPPYTVEDIRNFISKEHNL